MINKNDRKVFNNCIEKFVEKKGRLPCLEDIADEFPILAPTVRIVLEDKNLLEEIAEIYLENFESGISVTKGAQMRILMKESYKNNPELFKKFFILNIVRENKKTEEFQNTGREIEQLIIKIENALLSSMEFSRKHNSKSSGVSGKFRAYVKSLFPLFDEIGVKYRNVNDATC